jgi:hypothetical protein
MLTGVSLAKNLSIFKQPKALLSYSQQLFKKKNKKFPFPDRVSTTGPTRP